jgi:hypothetical protein
MIERLISYRFGWPFTLSTGKAKAGTYQFNNFFGLPELVEKSTGST